MYDDGYCSMGLGGRFYSYMSSDVDVGAGLFLGRAPHTKVILPDFHERGRVTRPSQVFPLVDGVVNGHPGFGASQLGIRA